jgi:hypothetical protein
MPFLRFRHFSAGFVALLFLFAISLSAALNEYQIKAGFLFQFTKFIDWPEESIPQSTLTLCVLGKDPFGPVLDQLQGETVKGRSVEIQRVGMGNIDRCQLLFVSPSEESRMPGILNAVKGKNILTVGEASRFLDQGGMIRFFIQDNKIRFEINNKEAQDSGLKISSKLLKIASRVMET